jgi:hypothetical protein
MHAVKKIAAMPSARDGLDIGSTASIFLWRALPVDARCVAMIRQGESAATNADHGVLRENGEWMGELQTLGAT